MNIGRPVDYKVRYDVRSLYDTLYYDTINKVFISMWAETYMGTRFAHETEIWVEDMADALNKELLWT